MRRRDRPGLDNRGKPGALLVIKDRGPRRCLARRQATRATRVARWHAVAHDLQRDARNLRRFASAPAVQDQGNRQQPSDLIGVSASSRKLTQIQRCVVRSNPDRCVRRKPSRALQRRIRFSAAWNAPA